MCHFGIPRHTHRLAIFFIPGLFFIIFSYFGSFMVMGVAGSLQGVFKQGRGSRGPPRPPGGVRGRAPAAEAGERFSASRRWNSRTLKGT